MGGHVDRSRCALLCFIALLGILTPFAGCDPAMTGVGDGGEGQGDNAPSGAPTRILCDDSCELFAGDGICDDGRPGADYSVCDWGTDCTDCGPFGDKLGAGVAADIDPQIFGELLFAEIQQLAPGPEVVPVDALPAANRPEGSVFGLQLEDGNNLFLMGTVEADGNLQITGAVLEDADGNVLLMQEIHDGGVTITQATGDSIDFEDLADDGLRITYTLNGTIPPTVIVVDYIGGEATVDESASVFGEAENPDYNNAPIRLPRSTTAKSIRASAKDARLPEAMAEDIACVLSTGSVMVIQFECTVFQFLTSKLPTFAVDGVCVSANAFLDSFRGSLPVPIDQGDEVEPKLVAWTKIGVAGGCFVARNLAEFGSILGDLSPPGLICMAVTLADEGSRITSPTGANLAQRICEELGVPPSPPDLPPLPEGPGCLNTCETANDGTCDDGGPDSEFAFCDYGTDCNDCGTRSEQPPPEEEDCSDDGICNPNCPDFDPDPNCTNEQLCAAKGFCCPDDRTCDFNSCNELDPDCDNAFFCQRDGICCDNDGVCDPVCPQEDPDCRIVARSTFDLSDEVWIITGRADGWEIADSGSPRYTSTGGNPGGHIWHQKAGAGTYWYFKSPSYKFIGDFSSAYGGTLTFDLKQSSSEPQDPTVAPFVILSNGEDHIYLHRPNPGTEWTSYTIVLDESAGWRYTTNFFTSRDATRDDIMNVLSSLGDLRIRGEFQAGPGTGSLDNVVLNGD